jgi:hypothetical protein
VGKNEELAQLNDNKLAKGKWFGLDLHVVVKVSNTFKPRCFLNSTSFNIPNGTQCFLCWGGGG